MLTAQPARPGGASAMIFVVLGVMVVMLMGGGVAAYLMVATTSDQSYYEEGAVYTEPIPQIPQVPQVPQTPQMPQVPQLDPNNGNHQTLTRAQVQQGMQAVAPAVQRCGNGQSGTVVVAVVISGATGRVTSATVSGSFAGTPVASCVTRAVRGASFPTFAQESLSVRYPFALQ